MEKVIIAGFAGVGKTFLAKKYKNVIDLESSRFVYDYSNVPETEYEKMKGTKNRIPNKNFPENYINAIFDSLKKYDVILLWLTPDMLQLYEQHNIKYSICYPSEKAFESYVERYKSRGNNDEWIQKVCGYYPKCVAQLQSNNHPKIILKENETLESFLLKKGYKLIKKD